MKQKQFLSFLAVVLVAVLFSTSAFAAGSYQEKDLPLGASSEVLMVGEIEPTIMSVTIPSYVPFHISRSVEGDNKVISPRVVITSHSGVPVNIDVAYTTVNLNGLKGTTWSDSQYVGENQVAIGFQPETLSNQLPTTLGQTKWLQANSPQYLNLTSLNPYGTSTLYVVGTLGAAVPEDSSFTVTPIFVVSKA